MCSTLPKRTYLNCIIKLHTLDYKRVHVGQVQMEKMQASLCWCLYACNATSSTCMTTGPSTVWLITAAVCVCVCVMALAVATPTSLSVPVALSATVTLELASKL